MKKQDSKTAIEDPLTELANLKMPLVLRDYQNFFDSATRSLNEVMALRGWEVTLVSAIIVVLLSRNAISGMATFLLFMLLLLFLGTECRIRAGMAIRNKLILKSEILLRETDLVKFKENIINWEYGVTSHDSVARKQLLKVFLRVLISPWVIGWHGIFFIAVTVLYFKMHK